MVIRDEQTVRRETTSLKLKPDLWKRAKIQAITENKQLSQLVEEALEAWLSLPKSKREGR